MKGTYAVAPKAGASREIRLTKSALSELNYKLAIFADDADLHESYGFNADRAEAMRNRFAKSKPGTFDVTEAEAEVIAGELENAADIERSNADSFFRGGNHNRAAALRKAAQSCKTEGGAK